MESNSSSPPPSISKGFSDEAMAARRQFAAEVTAQNAAFVQSVFQQHGVGTADWKAFLARFTHTLQQMGEGSSEEGTTMARDLCLLFRIGHSCEGIPRDVAQLLRDMASHYSERLYQASCQAYFFIHESNASDILLFPDELKRRLEELVAALAEAGILLPAPPPSLASESVTVGVQEQQAEMAEVLDSISIVAAQA
ncbi:MAG: hypothetical protein PHW10_03650 [Candidatus Peribacteraceae bacterium]|nr:hypothetical protein [Candidatus Peribacteraceae bacterium]